MKNKELTNNEVKARRKRTSKRGKSKVKDAFSKTTESAVAVDSDNDVSWYTKNQHLLDSAASLPYNYPIGTLFDVTNANFPAESSSGNFKAVSGILTMDLLTGPGLASDVNSAVNIAARDIYSWVRYANSGHANYDPQDLMMYYLAWDEVSMFIEYAKRVYGSMFMYNSQNRYAPKFLVEAQNWNYEDVNANLAQFRYAINSLVARFNALNVPKTFSYFVRHKWLYSNVYTDSTTAKAQLYLMRPAIVRVYNETGSTGGRLDVLAVLNDATDKMTVSKFVTYSNQLINALLGSEDIGIMSGDTLKAFGSDKCWVTDLIPENYSVYPVYNQEVLSQFQNATIIGTSMVEAGANSWSITQNPNIGQGIVTYSPIFYNSFETDPVWKNANAIRYSDANRIITSSLEAPKPGDTMVATRLTCITRPGSSGVNYAIPTSMGDAVVVKANTWQLTKIGADVAISMFAVTINGYLDRANMSDGAVRNLLRGLANLSNFDYHPMDVVTEVILDSSSAVTYHMPNVFFDVDNYTIINSDVLAKLHETALLAEFDVPIEFKASGKF